MRYTPSESGLAYELALAGASAADGQTSRLSAVARLLEAVPDPDIDPGFAARLEARLLLEAVEPVHATRPSPRPDEPTLGEAERRAAIIRFPRRRLVVRKAIAATVAAALALALPVVASVNALPGSPAYGLKLKMERLRVAAARDPVDRGFVWLSISDARLVEARELALVGPASLIPITVDRLATALETGASLILGSSSDPAVLSRAAGVLQRHSAALQGLLPTVPSTARGVVLKAIRTGQELSLRVAAALGLPTIRPPATVTPGAEPSASQGISTRDALGSSASWQHAMDPGTTSPRAPGSPVATTPDGGVSHATYTPCLSRLVDGGEAICPGALEPDEIDIVQIAELASPKRPAHPGAAPPVHGCPAAKTCRLYDIENYRWPATSGVATMRFWVNPRQSWIDEGAAISALVAAARTWNGATSGIRLSFQGLTDRKPAAGDSYNDIGWAPMDPSYLAIASIRRKAGRILGADIMFNAALPWDWTPCKQADGACNSVSGKDVLGRFDVQAVATHELGHALGLGHPEAPAEAAAEMTMYPHLHPGERKQATLGLGDVLGIRAAYPCRSCRNYPVYAP